jgi:TolB-like protein
LLQSEAYTVSEVAYKSGFNSPSYFIASFHEYFGYPPGEARKRGFEREEENALPPVTSKNKQKRAARRTFIITSSVILFFSAIVYLVYALFLKSNSSYTGNLSINSEKSIALLPFVTLSNSIDDQYFIEGVIDEIYINLNKISELRVISRISAEKYINASKSVSEIAKKLDANYIVRGSGQKYSNTVRLRVQLIDALKDRQLWSKSYEVETKEIKDIFKLQSQVAQNIASELEATIAPEEKQLIEKNLTSSLTAYLFQERG